MCIESSNRHHTPHWFRLVRPVLPLAGEPDRAHLPSRLHDAFGDVLAYRCRLGRVTKQGTCNVKGLPKYAGGFRVECLRDLHEPLNGQSFSALLRDRLHLTCV